MVIHNFSIKGSLPFLLLDLNINSLQCLCTALIIGVLRNSIILLIFNFLLITYLMDDVPTLLGEITH